MYLSYTTKSKIVSQSEKNLTSKFSTTTDLSSFVILYFQFMPF